MNESVKLNLGCGSQVLDGWINVDYALGARFTKIPFFRSLNRKIKLFNLDWNEKIFLHNLTKNFPWQNCSVDVVYSSHTLEHMSKEEGRKFLEECHRVLSPNGIIRIVVPDLQHVVGEYTNGNINAEDFVKELGVLYKRGSGSIKNRLAPFLQFPHKCMYDNKRLLAILKEIGFDASTRKAFDSEIENIRTLELESRTFNAVIIEGRKSN